MTLLLFIVSTTIKTSILLLLAFGAAALLKHRSAAWRHWVLTIAIAFAAAAPLLAVIVPSWHVPAIAALPTQSIQFARENDAITGRGQSPGAEVQAPEFVDGEAPAIARAAVAIWWTGVGFSLFVLAAGLGRLAWISARSRRIQSGIWAELADSISREHGLQRPVALVQTDRPALLVTWGVVRPEVIVPSAAQAWPRDRVRSVLAHELAHIRRRDWLVQMAAELLRCVYWFNPLVWIACRRIRLEAEHAADEAVLASGVKDLDYAAQLVDLARAFGIRRRRWIPAPAIARTSTLERRVRAMLNTSIDRSPMNRFTRAAIVVLLLGAAVAIAAAQGPFATLSGSIVDPMKGMLSNATLTLTNVQNQSKYEVRSDSAGRFEFVGLPSGEYLLEATFPGFRILRGTLSVSGQNLQRDLTMTIGSLEETITVRGGGSAQSRTGSQRPMRTSASRTAAECKPSPTGGVIRQPAKLDDAWPEYPQSLAAANVGGTVVLEAVIGTDGTMRDVRVVKPAHPDLDRAAADAVRQWRFSETLLNCTPIDVALTATVRFLPE